jgi:hypothetical protein
LIRAQLPRIEGGAAAPGVHDSAGAARSRAFSRGRSPHETAAAGRAGQWQRQPPARRDTVRRITASRAGPRTGRSRRPRGRRVPRRAAPPSRRRQEALAVIAARPHSRTPLAFHFVVKSAGRGRLCR